MKSWYIPPSFCTDRQGKQREIREIEFWVEFEPTSFALTDADSDASERIKSSSKKYMHKRRPYCSRSNIC